MDPEIRKMCRLASDGELEAFQDLLRLLLRKGYLPLEGRGGWIIKEEVNGDYWNGSQWGLSPKIYLSSAEAKDDASRGEMLRFQDSQIYVHKVMYVSLDKRQAKAVDTPYLVTERPGRPSFVTSETGASIVGSIKSPASRFTRLTGDDQMVDTSDRSSPLGEKYEGSRPEDDS